MQTYDFTPFYRSTVGFDRLFNRLDGLVGQEAKTYPPYNIEKIGESAYRVSIAVAGFAESDLVIESKENSLTVKGAKAPATEEKNREFLHRGQEHPTLPPHDSCRPRGPRGTGWPA